MKNTVKPAVVKTLNFLISHSIQLCVAVACALSAGSAKAATYTLNESLGHSNHGSSSDRIPFTDTSYWLVDDAVPSTCPQAGDTITWSGTSTWGGTAYFTLSEDCTVGSLNENYKCFDIVKADGVDGTVTLTFDTQLGTGGYQYWWVRDGVKLVVASTATHQFSYWSHGDTQLNIEDGGAAELYGKIQTRVMRINVNNGGTLVFDPSYFRSNEKSPDGNSVDYDAINVSSGGSATFPSGINMTLGNGNSYTEQFNQSGGTVTFGDNFTSALPWTYTWSGGTLNITDDSMFGANIALTVPDSATVTLAVASGKTFSAPGLVADVSATITKTGAGTFAFAPNAANIVLEAGAIGLASAESYDLSNVSLGSGASASIAIITMGARVNSLPAALSGATFTADLSSIAQGTVLFYSSDPTVLAKVRADLASSVPQGFQLAVSGEALSLEAVSDYVFNASGNLLTDLTSWSTGSIPPAGAEVAIDGANVVADFTAGEIPAWASIEVKNGATLKISADADLPHVVLNKNASLEIVSGTTFFTNGLSCTPAVVGENVSLPVLSVATNATLSVAAGMKFKNVDFRLYGTVTKESDADDSPVFGYAENGETSYFALTADGGVFDFHSNQSVNKGSVLIVCPTSGGKVVPVGTITLRNSSRTVTGWADFGDWQFGHNNPANVSFDVLVDGTHLDCASYFYAAGGAHLTLVNGSYIRRNTSCLGHYFSQAIQDSASIAVGEGCFLDFTAGGGANFGVDSQSVIDAVIVRDGGAYTVSYNSSGWGLGVFVSDGGILGVTKLYKPSSGDPRERTDLLRGFGSARLDGDLEIASVNIGTGNYDWDRHVKMANVPFVGSGDVTITNGVPEYPFTVTMVNGASTATGSIKVDKVEGDAETALYFADGANWAGTVVAGNVLLTNLTDGVDAATATFGTLDLAADFNIRVWAENGVVVTNDMVNVGQYRSSGGRLSIELMSEGLEFVAGDKIVVGTIAKSSPNPAVRVGWCVKRLTIDGDDENEILVMKKGVGLQLILR